MNELESTLVARGVDVSDVGGRGVDESERVEAGNGPD